MKFQSNCLVLPDLIGKFRIIIFSVSIVCVCNFSSIYSQCATPVNNPVCLVDGIECGENDNSIINIRVALHIMRLSNCSEGYSMGQAEACKEKIISEFQKYNIIVDVCIFEFCNDFAWIHPAQFLGIMESNPESINDGINGYLYPYADNQARNTPSTAFICTNALNWMVAVHEMGHCLGLHHTDECSLYGFECVPRDDDSKNTGDRVCDTPADRLIDIGVCTVPPYNDDHDSSCGTFQNVCNGDLINPLLDNIMQQRPCLVNFTNGQKTRMKRMLNECPQLTFVKGDGAVHIKENTHWNLINSMVFDHDVIVDPGVTLTITSSQLYFANSRFLILEGGSSLIVDHSTLTRKIGYRNYCGNSDCGPFWGGIRIGNKIPGNRVHITFIEGEIDYSYNGIHNSSTISQTSQISLNGTDFYNNRIGINIRSRGFFGGLTNANNCQFEIDSDYPGDHIQSQLQFGNGTVTLTNCSVVNQTTFYTSNIAAISQINCGLTMSNCKPIKGYYYGLEALGGGARPYVVKNCEFEKAYCNIISSGVNSFTISNNKFKLKDNYPNSTPGYGIILNKANKFTISGNQFSNSNLSASQSGINILATHPSDINYISKENSFSNLTNGILTSSTETSNSLNDNLYLTCNDFDKCVNDILLNVGTSIYPIQRFGDGPAGNTFSQSSNTFQYLNNTQAIQNLTYWYNSLNNVEYPVRRVRVIPTIHNRPASISRCYVKPCPTPCSPEIRFQELITSLNALHNDLNQLLDGGQSSVWISAMQNSDTNNSATLFSSLVNLSPNISTNLMFAFWQRANIYTTNQRLQLLHLNLDLLENNDFRSFFIENSSDFNSDTVNVLLSCVAASSNRKHIEDSLRQINVELEVLIESTIQVLYSQEEIDSTILDWYDRIGRFDATIDKTLFQLHNNNLTQAESTISQIQSLNSLNDYDFNERINFIELFALLDTIYTNNQFEGELDNSQIQTLIDIAEPNIGRSSQIARNILKFYFNIILQDPQNILQYSKNNKVENNLLKLKDNLEINQSKFSVFPNPASDKISIESLAETEIKLLIYDYFGKLYYSTIVPKRQFIKINTFEWSRGLFFVKVEIDGIIDTKKLILN